MLTAARVAAETVTALAALKQKCQRSHVFHGGEATTVLDISVAWSGTRLPLWVANEDSPRHHRLRGHHSRTGWVQFFLFLLLHENSFVELVKFQVCSIEFHDVIPSYVDLLNDNSVNIDHAPLESFDLDGMVVVLSWG
jgi:hypothetical protein